MNLSITSFIVDGVSNKDAVDKSKAAAKGETPLSGKKVEVLNPHGASHVDDREDEDSKIAAAVEYVDNAEAANQLAKIYAEAHFSYRPIEKILVPPQEIGEAEGKTGNPDNAYLERSKKNGGWHDKAMLILKAKPQTITDAVKSGVLAGQQINDLEVIGPQKDLVIKALQAEGYKDAKDYGKAVDQLIQSRGTYAHFVGNAEAEPGLSYIKLLHDELEARVKDQESPSESKDADHGYDFTQIPDSLLYREIAHTTIDLINHSREELAFKAESPERKQKELDLIAKLQEIGVSTKAESLRQMFVQGRYTPDFTFMLPKLEKVVKIPGAQLDFERKEIDGVQTPVIKDPENPKILTTRALIANNLDPETGAAHKTFQALKNGEHLFSVSAGVEVSPYIDTDEANQLNSKMNADINFFDQGVYDQIAKDALKAARLGKVNDDWSLGGYLVTDTVSKRIQIIDTGEFKKNIDVPTSTEGLKPILEGIKEVANSLSADHAEALTETVDSFHQNVINRLTELAQAVEIELEDKGLITERIW
jgi:hypothetical protein